MKKKNLGNKRILIVDQNPEILKFLEEETRKIGVIYQFEKADTFPQAVDSILSGQYDLVILDFPGIRGPYLLNLAVLREIPVVLLVSINFFSFEAHHLLEKRIMGLLPKENLSEIIPVIENLLSQKSSSDPPGGSKDVIS